MTVTTDVRFCLNVGPDVCVDEADLGLEFDMYRDALLSDGSLSGAVSIHIDSQPTVHIWDQVLYTVHKLCFAAVTEIVAGRGLSIPYFSSAGQVVLEPAGDDVRLWGDVIPTITVHAGDLARALFACGTRFVAFYRRLLGSDAAYQPNLVNLDRAADLAAQSLRQRESPRPPEGRT